MLRELRIKNFAIIDALSLGFGRGLNVLTGETGAGKSIIVDALGIALGERAYVEMIKTGSSDAVVEALFDVPVHQAAENLGIDSAEGIILRRQISSSGKGRAYVNDTLVSVQSLLDIGRALVDIHGQHEHQSLLQKESRLRLIDRAGRLEAERDAFSALFEETNSIRKRLEEIKKTERERAQRLDLLSFQIGEIRAANPTGGEDVLLEEERNLLLNISKLRDLLESSYGLLYGSEGASLEKLSGSVLKLREMSSFDKDAAEPLKLLEEAKTLVEEAVSYLRANKDKYDTDPERLSTVEERLEIIKGLKRKYGDTLKDVLGFLADAEREISLIENAEEETAGLEKELSSKESRLLEAASALSEKRKAVSANIEEAVNGAIKGLAMEKAVFSIELKEAPATSTGSEEAEFLFSANPGEALKTLSRVASGGEISRLMLALKGTLGDADEIPVLIFDEVDSGIGGSAAEQVAARLKELSASHQVMCITHLPQIASKADCHILVEKAEKKGGVYVKVKELSGEERRREIARMLSGKLTDASLRHASELMAG